MPSRAVGVSDEAPVASSERGAENSVKWGSRIGGETMKTGDLS